jgi:hypothetical protein
VIDALAAKLDDSEEECCADRVGSAAVRAASRESRCAVARLEELPSASGCGWAVEFESKR